MSLLNIREIWRRLIWWHKIVLWFVTGCLVWTLAGFFLLPPVTRIVLEKQLSQALHRDTAVGRVAFNPWTLELGIQDFSVARNDAPGNLLSFRQLTVNLEVASLFKRALILSSIRLDGPACDFTRYADGRFSFDDLIPADKDSREEESASRPFYFSLNNIEINQGSLVVTDLQGNTVHEIGDINIAVPFISNMAHKVDIYVQPRFGAVFNGAAVEFEGSAKPFVSSRETHLDINVKDLDITHYTGYLPDFLNISLESALFNGKVTLSFIQPSTGVPVVSLEGAADLTDVEILLLPSFGNTRATKFFALKALSVEFLPSNLLEGKIHLKKIAVHSPDITVTRDRNARLNLSGLVSRADMNTEGPLLLWGMVQYDLNGLSKCEDFNAPKTSFRRLLFTR